MQKTSKWADDDEHEFTENLHYSQNNLSLPTKLQEEPDLLKQKSFLNWASKPAKPTPTSKQTDKLARETSRIGELLTREQKHSSVFKEEASGVTPVVQTIKKDSLKCSVKTIDFLESTVSESEVTCLFAGVGKVLSILHVDISKRKYTAKDSFFFQNENILKSRFLDSKTIASQLVRKKCISVFDTVKEKSTKIFKLFSQNASNNSKSNSKFNGFVECFDVNPSRSLMCVSSRNLFGLIDPRTKGAILHKNLMKSAQKLRFSGDSCVNFQTNSGMFSLDLR